MNQTALDNPGARASGDEAVDLLALLIEQTVDYAIFVLDRDGLIASWNPGAQRIKGYGSAEIIGKPYGIFFTSEDRSAGKPNTILNHVRTHGRYQEEGWRVRKDGTRFWASVVVTALRDRRGELRGFAKITRDLTDRRQAEETGRLAAAEQAARRQAELDEGEMRRSRDQLDLILRSITEGVTVQARDRTLIFVNDAAAVLCGYSSAETLLAAPAGQLFGRLEIFREDGAPFPYDELPGRLALQGKPSNAVVRFRVKGTGEERWSFVSGAPVFDANGNVDLAVSVFREFTDRRRSEQAWQFLAEASAALAGSMEYEQTLKQVAALAVPRIADWAAVDLSSPEGALVQLATAEVEPSALEGASDWRAPWLRAQAELAQQVLCTGVPCMWPDITDTPRGGAGAEQEAAALPLGRCSAMVVPLTVGKKPFGALSFLTVQSARRYREQDLILATEVARRASLAIENARAYREAQEAVRTRDNFLAIASHELRTPLSALSVLISSLVRAGASGRLAKLSAEAINERFIKAERQMAQISRLVDRLLDVSRLSSRDLNLERQRTDLAEIVRDVISRYEDAAAEAGTRIEFVGAGPVIGWWDRSRLDQVVTNLIGNALKYGGQSPITASLSSASSGHVRLTVRDDGPGIPVEHQERIFEQFERATDSENLPGMGLGLWLVRRIVTAHGGTTSVDSTPGHGAAFTVVLPTGDRSEQAPERCASAPGKES